MQNNEYSNDISSIEEMPEFRIYASGMGGEPVAWDIRGKRALDRAIESMANQYPHDTLVVREVLEHVIMTINPRMPTVE